MAETLTLVIGGAASGKSAHAERRVLQDGGRPVYVATAEAHDAEMSDKIRAHRARRGDSWREVEAPHRLEEALQSAAPGEAMLIDCATMWLTNRLLAGDDLEAAEERLLAALVACPARVTIVTNEIGLSPVPDNALARAFREAQGRLNQRLAAAADEAIAVWAGLPLRLK
ncbi:bifunctional adenosylcobinamide kinase/adenosylcobinamide-phosphate guanylyltransferase [Pseudoroseicyclus tamaricis]|uniref:Bifunctional adenosylcobalamin biosynthesis protein n=1 Tax=Pseudoroseicyclus tamaricis TaxID=2705421 RepID=A0A6B2JQ71_9RHOB|nr:bifunctional adenosylcobinamide kinase/adenosylcobinamide-phosphate guanylyltransferase [Pseudoroseicyclus tamaricis]NDV00115.1 bifunctional adenosylcobinamide kinase/adenosylcobinamide-phosphate guanylyltransferase [Pseudoroseicyclus tamaricis]